MFGNQTTFGFCSDSLSITNFLKSFGENLHDSPGGIKFCSRNSENAV